MKTLRVLLQCLLVISTPVVAAARPPSSVPYFSQVCSRFLNPAQPSYRIEFVGASERSSIASGLNNAGTVSGHYLEPVREAFTYRQSQTSILPFALGKSPATNAINDRGQIVGYDYDSAKRTITPVTWVNGKPWLLDNLGLAHAEPRDINNSGEAVGSVGDWGDVRHFKTVIWRGTATEILPSYPGFTGQLANAMNAHGEVVGKIYPETGMGQAFYYYAGQIELLEIPSNWESVSASDINDQGYISGHGFYFDSKLGFYVLRPLLWTPTHQIRNLPELSGFNSTAAWSLNDCNELTGVAMPDDGSVPEDYRAFVMIGNSIYNLNELIPAGTSWQLIRGHAINNRGEIIGLGIFKGIWHGFKLIPS